MCAGLAEQHVLVPGQNTLPFVNNRPFVNFTLIGDTSMQQLKNDINSIKLNLSTEVGEEIRRGYPVSML